MRKNLIIIALWTLSSVMSFAQTIETISVSKAPNGRFSKVTNDGTIEGYVMNGKKEGTWIQYANATQYLPKKIVSYQNGKKNGVSIEIDKSGVIVEKAEYKNDVLDGQSSSWYHGGRLSKLNTYKEGKLHGEQIVCYEKGGYLEVSNYKNGERDGVTTWYDENGTPKMTIEYKNGQFDGKQETFYSNGSLKSEAVYKNGKLQGKKKTYAEKDKPKIEEKGTEKIKNDVKGKQETKKKELDLKGNGKKVFGNNGK